MKVKKFPCVFSENTFAFVVESDFFPGMFQIMVQAKGYPATPPVGDIGDPFGGSREDVEKMAEMYANDQI